MNPQKRDSDAPSVARRGATIGVVVAVGVAVVIAAFWILKIVAEILLVSAGIGILAAVLAIGYFKFRR